MAIVIAGREYTWSGAVKSRTPAYVAGSASQRDSEDFVIEQDGDTARRTRPHKYCRADAPLCGGEDGGTERQADSEVC